MPPSLPFLQAPRGKSGAEWVGPGSGNWGVTCNPKGLGQNTSLHSKLSLKIGGDNWQINNPNLNFIMEEILWWDWIESGWFDMSKNLKFKPSLQMWWKFWIQGSSSFASINMKYSGSERLIFRRLSLPLIFLVLIDWVVVRSSSPDGGRRRRGLRWSRWRLRRIGPLSCNFSFRDDLVIEFWFSW